MRMTTDTWKFFIEIYIHVGILCQPKVKSHFGVGFCWSQALLWVFLAVLMWGHKFVIEIETLVFLTCFFPLKNASEELPELKGWLLSRLERFQISLAMLPVKRLSWHISAGCFSRCCAVVKLLNCLSGNFWLSILITTTKNIRHTSGTAPHIVTMKDREAVSRPGAMVVALTLRASPPGLWRLPRTQGDSVCCLLPDRS